MNKIRTVSFILLVIFTSFSFAQEKAAAIKENSEKQKYMTAEEFLKDDQYKMEFLAKKYPGPLYLKESNKAAKVNSYVVGATRSFFAKDRVNNTFYKVPSTCQKVGTNCYIFVEDAVWGTRVTQTAIDAIQDKFDNNCPANASKGIYQMDVESFGNPPDVDKDPKIIILILDIKDGYTPGNSYVQGYFHGWNEYLNTDLVASGYEPTSNECEMYYLDANPLDLTNPEDVYDATGTIAHEFQHMIHFNYHDDQITFFNEGCSEVASVVCGYPLRDQSRYNSETNRYLLDWRDNSNDVLNDYARAARFFTYFYDQYGVKFLRSFVLSSYIGFEGFKYALKKVNTTLTVPLALKNWFLANAVNDKTIDAAFGYTTANVGLSAMENHYSSTQNPTTETIYALGVKYMSYKNGSNLKATFSSDGTGIVVKAIKKGASGTVISDVPLGKEFSEPEYGTKYNEIDFAIMNTSEDEAAYVTYTSSGSSTAAAALELKWDNTEPMGFRMISDNTDTLCVIFNNAPGGIIKTIKTAVRRNSGAISGGIFEFTGSTLQPLGKKLGSFDVPLSGVPDFGYTAGSGYPVPYPGWTEADVSALKIPADKQFAVAYSYNIANNGVMVTDKYTGGGADNSWTYTTASSTGTKKWIYYVSNSAGDTVSIYLSRAVIDFGSGTGVEEVSGNSAIPAAYALDQNYPNPFNPSTVINYQLLSAGNTSLKVYDMLGREVETLFNGFQNAGTHSMQFNASKYTSGIYLYELKSGSFRSVKKMMLVK